MLIVAIPPVNTQHKDEFFIKMYSQRMPCYLSITARTNHVISLLKLQCLLLLFFHENALSGTSASLASRQFQRCQDPCNEGGLYRKHPTASLDALYNYFKLLIALDGHFRRFKGCMPCLGSSSLKQKILGATMRCFASKIDASSEDRHLDYFLCMRPAGMLRSSVCEFKILGFVLQHLKRIDLCLIQHLHDGLILVLIILSI